MARTQVLISGYYGFDNLGDEAILEELVSELGEFFDSRDIVVLSNNPQQLIMLMQDVSCSVFVPVFPLPTK